jgi:MFS family permease
MRNVIAMGIVSFFTDFSTEMVLGVLPLFIVGNLGAPRAILGAIEGSAELVSYAVRMLSGSLSDKTGNRKKYIFAGYALSTASKPFFAASAGWLDAFIVRIMDRAGKGIRAAPRDALIADSVSESKSGRAFGLHRTMDQLGAVIGPVAAFALLQWQFDIRGVFLFSLIPGVIALMILAFAVKEVEIKKRRINATILSNLQNVLKENKPFLFLLIITSVFGIGAFNFSFVLLRASDLGVDKSVVPLVYAVINISHTFIGIPSGALADRIGKEKVLLLSYLTFLISSITMFALSGSSLYAYIIATVFGIYVGVSETVQRAIIPRYAHQELRGTAFGLFNLIVGSSYFIGNIVFGILWDSKGLFYSLTYSIITTIAAIIMMSIFIKKCSAQAHNQL